MFDRWYRVLLIGTLLLIALPTLAAAGGLCLTSYPVGVVHPGDVVELAWARPPAGVEELEVVLSIDDGRTYAIRVSPELERDTGRWTWRVPRLSAEHARLSVRHGREHEERLGPPTPAFRIASAPAPGTAPDLRSAWVTNSQGSFDWWDESDAAPRAYAGPALAGGASLERGDAFAAAGVLPRRAPGPALAASPAAGPAGAAQGVAFALSLAPVSREPRFVPRRE